MPEPENVWLLTAGTYSDYQVLAVYTDKAKADAALAYYNEIEKDSYGQAVLEQLPIRHESPRRVPELSIAARIIEGVTTEVRESTRMEWEFTPTKPTCTANVVDQTRHEHNVKGQVVKSIPATAIHVSGTDTERVRKVFAERLAEEQAKAAGL